MTKMIKRLLFLLLILLTLDVSAQIAVGSWRHYPVYSSSITKIIDSDRRVYFVNSGFLYGYDKKNDEQLAFDHSNLLSDVSIRNIFYNHEKHYLAVVYENGNIDLLFDDGNVVNLPDIKDATLNIAPMINDVAFFDNKIYVATNFGLVVFDDNKYEVRESGIYNRNINNVIPMRNHIAINSGKESFTISADKKINKFENFTSYVDDLEMNSHITVDAEKGIFAANIYSVVAKLTVDPATGVMTRSNYGGFGSNITSSNLIDIGDSFMFTTQAGKIYSVEKASGKWTLHGEVPDILKGNMISSVKGLSDIWAVSNLGLANYDISGSGVTVKHDRIKPDGTTTVVKPAYFFPSYDGERFYIQNLGRSHFRSAGTGEGTTLVQLADVYSDGEFTSIAPAEVSAKISHVINAQKNIGAPLLINPTSLAEDPDDPSRIYMASGSEGIYVIKDGEEIGKFDGDNSPLPNLENAGWRALCVRIDRYGNLWVTMHDYDNYIFVLPSDKRKGDPSKVKASDWVNATKIPITSSKDAFVLPCEKSNMVLVFPNHLNLIAIDTRGTGTNFADDQSRSFNSFTDQDGKSFWIGVPSCMVEDKEGRVWIGTAEGIVEITRPAALMSSDFRINHLKVPRNDGTNLADYLLEKEKINDIAVDNSNRKWVATDASGVYLVSPDGDKILEHYTTENSLLPSNRVYCVYAHPTSNSIFFGTPYGISEYSSTSAPSRPDYSEVYAYPNPVTPDYTGWITITGLMNDSRVKICDSAMQIVYETRSEGGMATWDGCGFSGARVKSGVYYVLASTGADATDSAADVVAKILIVN